MPWVLELVGTRCGKLYVERFVGFRRGRPMMFCRCDCGGTTLSTAHHLRDGASKACGCARKETMRKFSTKHGYSLYRGQQRCVYRSWKAMLQRCRNPNDSNYKNYGGRGIVVCDRWIQFENFLADMGEPPFGHSIERKNNDGNYEPGNCIWATQNVQAANQRSNWHVTFGGIEMTVAEATRRSGLKGTRIYKFLYDQSASKGLVIPVDGFVESVRIK